MTEISTQSNEAIYSRFEADEAAAAAARERSQKAKNFFTKSITKGVLAYRTMRLAQTIEELEAQNSSPNFY